MKQKALFVNAKKKTSRVEDVESFGPVDFAVDNYGKDLFTFGMGPLAGSIVPGTHRLIFVNRSTLWEGIFTSTSGGAAVQMYSLGVNYVSILDKGDKHQILKLKNQQAEFAEIEEKELEKIFDGYKNKKGTHALQQYVFDKYAKEYINENCTFRILAVGPAALKTTYGGICSTVVDKDHFREGMDSWAGRGGFGSVLAQKHKVVAVIYGGNHEDDARLKNLQKINKIFNEEFKEAMAKAIMNAGKKYYYDEALKTGGTFGSNYTTLKDWFLSFNWNSIYYTDSQRQEMYEKMIKGHYLKQFNEEIIEPRKFTTCGETCPIMCKKWDTKKYKKDYEPYEANGPNSGIFDQRAAEKVVHRVDELGYDSIEAGNMISWIMDMIDQEIIEGEDYGIKEMPKFKYENFDLINDSKHNAELAIKIAEMIITDKGKIFQKGIREASKKLGKKARDLALYTPNCEGGSIAPCQYWVPAFFLPIPIQGKFLSDYEVGFRTPYELGKSSADRMIKELYSTNTGICRFHRKWSEKLIQKLVNELMGLKMNYYEHHRELVRKIRELNKCKKSTIWESEKVVDVIQLYYEKLYRADKENKELEDWVNKFRNDKWKAAQEYWNEVIRGFNEVVDK